MHSQQGEQTGRRIVAALALLASLAIAGCGGDGDGASVTLPDLTLPDLTVPDLTAPALTSAAGDDGSGDGESSGAAGDAGGGADAADGADDGDGGLGIVVWLLAALVVAVVVGFIVIGRRRRHSGEQPRPATPEGVVAQAERIADDTALLTSLSGAAQLEDQDRQIAERSRRLRTQLQPDVDRAGGDRADRAVRLDAALHSLDLARRRWVGVHTGADHDHDDDAAARAAAQQRLVDAIGGLRDEIAAAP
ncbi:MAG: hypothetical protein ACK5OX_15900 [Desertimonas sp.]